MEDLNQTNQTSRQHLNRRTVILAVSLFILIVLGMFVFAFIKQSELKVEQTVPIDNSATTEDRYGDITRIDGKHFFIDGVHTVVGEIPMPTPCDLLEGQVLVAESYPEQITLDFKVINNAEFCAQAVTAQRFKLSATASPDATFSALFQNRAVELNLVEAAAGETPEDFELFRKG